ncbi:unnamed protein product, partial [Iphiclides podalirius]
MWRKARDINLARRRLRPGRAWPNPAVRRTIPIPGRWGNLGRPASNCQVQRGGSRVPLEIASCHLIREVARLGRACFRRTFPEFSSRRAAHFYRVLKAHVFVAPY